MAQTDAEWLDSRIDLLTNKILTNFKPREENIHRQIVDFRRDLLSVKDNIKKIKKHTGIDITSYVKTFLDR